MVAFGSHYYMTTGCYLYKAQNIRNMTTTIIIGIMQLCTLFLAVWSAYKDGYAKGVGDTYKHYQDTLEKLKEASKNYHKKTEQ